MHFLQNPGAVTARMRYRKRRFGRHDCTRVIAGCGGHLQHSCPRPKLTFDTGFAASCFPHRAKLTPETGPETALFCRLYPVLGVDFRATNPITKLTYATHAPSQRWFCVQKCARTHRADIRVRILAYFRHDQIRAAVRTGPGVMELFSGRPSMGVTRGAHGVSRRAWGFQRSAV